MDEKKHILIVEDSEVTLYKLKAILVRLGYVVSAFDRSELALEWLKASQELPDLIISDVIMPEMDGYAFIKQIRSAERIKKIPIILLTSHDDFKDRVAGLEAGADDYLSKNVSPAELELRVKALLSRSQIENVSIAQSDSKTISIFSLRGGVGTTSISVNLAIAIAQLWSIETCLWDMALSSSQCALMLNLKPKNTPVSLTSWPEGSIEESLLRSMLLDHESGVKLLPAPQSFEESEMISKRVVDLVWTPLQMVSPYLIVDAGNHFTDPVISILERSDAILLIMAPELASVNSAYQAIRIFEKMGFDNSKILPVVNRIFPRSSITSEKIAKGLKLPLFAEIPFDTINMVQAINKGIPYMMLAPKSSVSKTISEMAYKLTSNQHQE
ncbi:MAG: response regulator [Chloroflexi bacterium]|nr:response regulator [Chloroflexota bacterium]